MEKHERDKPKGINHKRTRRRLTRIVNDKREKFRLDFFKMLKQSVRLVYFD